MKPVITQTGLSENQFEITMKTGSENYLQGCIELMNYGNKLCREKSRISIRRTKKNEPDTRGYNPIWTQVVIIECFPKGVWIKTNGDESERQKDIYECTKDLHLYRERLSSLHGHPCQLIDLNGPYWDFFDFCMQAKGYEFVEKREEEDLKSPVPQPPLGGNWDFLVESKTGDNKLYLDWDSVMSDYDGVRWGDEVTFRVKGEYTNGNYAILTFKYYCTEKKYVVMHGAGYNGKNQLIEDKNYPDGNFPKSIFAESPDVKTSLYEILCAPHLNKERSGVCP